MDPNPEHSDQHSDYSEESEVWADRDPPRRTRTVDTSEPSPEPVESTLEHAINTAPLAELRALVKHLIRAQPVAKDLASRHLLAPIAGSVSRKRKAFEKCVNCEEDYRVTDNI